MPRLNLIPNTPPRLNNCKSILGKDRHQILLPRFCKPLSSLPGTPPSLNPNSREIHESGPHSSRGFNDYSKSLLSAIISSTSSQRSSMKKHLNNDSPNSFLSRTLTDCSLITMGIPVE